MSTSITWKDLVSKIKGVATKTSGSQSITTSGKWGFTTQYGPFVYIPTNAYYTTSHWLNIPWNTIKGLLGTASTGNVLTGISFTSQNGIKLSGSMQNFSSSIQTATTSTSDQSKSCYRLNNGYIEVVPAIGYWGRWDWSKSCIKVPFSSNIGLSKCGNGSCNTHITEQSTVSASSYIYNGILICFSARDHSSLYDTSISASSSNCGLSEIGNYSETGSITSSIMRVYKITNLASGKTITIKHVGTSVQFAIIKIN